MKMIVDKVDSDGSRSEEAYPSDGCFSKRCCLKNLMAFFKDVKAEGFPHLRDRF
jgi:hypothetical protein